MLPLIVALSSLYGLVIGSFLNAVVYRVPRKETLSTRSHCPNCDHQISAWENVPVFSYLALRGKCRGCGLPIHWRYPAVELAGAAFFGVVAWATWAPLSDQYGPGLAVLVLIGLCWLAAASIALSLIDWEHQLLPNAIVYPTLWVLLATLGLTSLLSGDYERVFTGLAGLAGMGVFYAAIWFWKPGAMGFGDVRLSWVLGFTLAWWDLSALAVGFFAPFFLASLYALVLVFRKSASGKTGVAFGPWMLMGAWVGIFAGPSLVDMYLSLGGIR